MKIKYIYFVIVLFLDVIAQGVTIPTGIPSGKIFLSPDRLKSLKVANDGRESHYEIIDVKTGNKNVLDDACIPVLELKWSPDSLSIFAVAHISGGTVLHVFHLSNNKWNKFTVNGPDENVWALIIFGWNIKSDKLIIYAKASIRVNNRSIYTFYKCNFAVDPSTGKTSMFHKTPLTREEFSKLKSNF